MSLLFMPMYVIYSLYFWRNAHIFHLLDDCQCKYIYMYIYNNRGYMIYILFIFHKHISINLHHKRDEGRPLNPMDGQLSMAVTFCK